MMNEKHFNVGDRVLVRVSYFMDHHLERPILLNRYGIISAITDGTPFDIDPIGIRVSYNVKMDNGIDLIIDDPAYLLDYNKSKIKSPPNYTYCLPYDLLNAHAKDLVSDTVNKAREFIAKNFNTNILQKEKQMANTSIYRVIFNDPATIILWDSFHFEDKECEINGAKCVKRILVRDKTVVKCAKGEKFNKYNGFCAAVTKRIFETNSAIQHIIQKAQDDSDAKKLVKEITKTGKKVKAQRENMKRSTKKNG